jgi:hypothetical protein
MKIPGGYPCKLCGKVMYDTAEGQGFTAGKFRFVACRDDCAPKITAAARVTGQMVKLGLEGLAQQKAPGLLPLLKQLGAAYNQAKQDPQ